MDLFHPRVGGPTGSLGPGRLLQLRHLCVLRVVWLLLPGSSTRPMMARHLVSLTTATTEQALSYPEILLESCIRSVRQASEDFLVEAEALGPVSLPPVPH